MAKISHTKIKQPSFGEKKAKINLHQNFPIYGILFPLPRGHHPYKATFSLQKRWSYKRGLSEWLLININ